jgi:hypothetical protein
VSNVQRLGRSVRVGFLLVGLAFLGLGLSPLLKGQAFYQSYWGGAAFAPLVALIGVGMLFVGVFRWEQIQKREPPQRKKHHR